MDSASDFVSSLTSGIDDGQQWISGINNLTIVLFAVLVFVAWLFTNRVEKFTTAMIVTDDEYIQDVKNTASYVGPYIGEIYLYLRGKYHTQDVLHPGTGPMFQPGSINDPTLSDPILPIARTQIKSWIDSAKLRMKDKYGEAMVTRLKPLYDITYTVAANGILQVINIFNGKAATYLV